MRQNQVQKSTENREAAFRHEWKHMVGYGDLLALRSRLAAVMAQDSHGVNGRYAVRSLYFDNLRDKALREKLDGVDCREKFRVRWEKFRVRYYNGDLSLLLLEKKSKLHGLCRKEQAQLTLDQARAVSSGELRTPAGSGDPLLWELCYKMETQGLRPRIIVDYTREAYVCEAGNVRVTLDYDIRRLRHGAGGGRAGDPGGEVGRLSALRDPGRGPGPRRPHIGLFQIRGLPDLRLTR